MELSEKEITNWRSFLKVFRDANGRELGSQLTYHQILVIDAIATRRYPRIQLILPTQYGKSLAVALGLIIRVTEYPEPWFIVAPTEDKSRIIMDYVIDHLFDHEMFYQRLDFNGTKEKLKQERSKSRLTFRGAGEIRLFTANATNKQAVKKALMGFGAPNGLIDESSLIDDDLYSTAKRMVGGSQDNFLLEIGNPFFRNHFYRTWTGERYQKVLVDYQVALSEGRYTEEYINEMREEAFFDVLYECKFPAEDQILPGGYRRLVSSEVLEQAFIDELPPTTTKDEEGNEVQLDKPILGIDVARGGANKTIFVVRWPTLGFAKKVKELDMDNLELIADEAEDIIKQYGIGDYRTAPDDTGVGGGLTDILKRRGHLVKPVMFGESASSKRYANLKAEMNWEFRKWLREGGKIVRDPGFLEIGYLNYKENASGRLQMEPKEELGKRNIPSPDNADALVLTFIDTSQIIDDDDIELI